MKMDVSELSMEQLEELLSRLERLSLDAHLVRTGSKVELKIY